MERFANNPSTVVNQIGGIDGVTDPVPITVENASHFPSAGNFRIMIDGEILLVTSVSGNSFTATRGVEGSQITSHENGATVVHILTAGALQTKWTELLLNGPYNNLPAAGVVGRSYYCTDSPYMLVDDGTNWKHFVGGHAVTPPQLSDFSWVNQGTATAVSTYGGLFLNDTVANSNSFDVAMLVRTAPTPTYSCVFGFITYYTSSAYHLPAVVQRESSSGKIITLRYGTNNNMFLEIVYDTATSPTTASTPVVVQSADVFLSYPVFIKITDDGTTRKYYLSSNPYFFPQLYYSVATATFATPDQVGFSINTYNQPQACHWIHYSEGP